MAFITPTELRKLERETLKRVTQIPEFGKLGELQLAANVAIPSINEQRGPVDVNLGFTLDIRLRGERKSARRRLDLGALVVPSADNKSVDRASYSLMICRYADPKKSPIVRKVHFDYEPPTNRNDAEPKPSHHLQVCGKLSRHHLEAGYDEMRLRGMYPRWEKPRIPAPPTSIALMLNWLFLEFQSDPASQAVLRSTEWRACVSEAEREILLPYYSGAKEFLGSTGEKKRRFMQAHLYGIGTE